MKDNTQRFCIKIHFQIPWDIGTAIFIFHFQEKKVDFLKMWHKGSQFRDAFNLHPHFRASLFQYWVKRTRPSNLPEEIGSLEGEISSFSQNSNDGNIPFF